MNAYRFTFKDNGKKHSINTSLYYSSALAEEVISFVKNNWNTKNMGYRYLTFVNTAMFHYDTFLKINGFCDYRNTGNDRMELFEQYLQELPHRYNPNYLHQISIMPKRVFRKDRNHETD